LAMARCGADSAGWLGNDWEAGAGGMPPILPLPPWSAPVGPVVGGTVLKPSGRDADTVDGQPCRPKRLPHGDTP